LSPFLSKKVSVAFTGFCGITTAKHNLKEMRKIGRECKEF
jgi:hypothetical protein